MRRVPLRRRIGALLSAVAAILVLLLVGSSVLLQQTRDEQHKVVVDYFTVLRAGNDGFTALIDAETAIRGYALTGDPATLQPLDELQSPRLKQESAASLRIVRREPELSAAYDRAAAAARTWYAEWAAPVQAQIRASGARAVTDASILQGKALFDRLRAAYQDYIAALRRHRDTARDHLQTETNLLFVAVVVSLLIAAGLAVAIWVFLLRWVVRPLDRLAAETRTVRSGDFDHVVRVEGPPEVEQLGADVDAMRQGLVATLAQVRSASDEVEAARTMLERQAEDLARSNRDLEQFAYVASHDLQEPLRKVASFCQLLQKRYGGQLDERADQYIEFAVDGAKRMQALINDLLAFSRVGRFSPGQAEVPLDACFRSAVHNLELAIEDAGAVVTADALPVVHGEAALLTQLLQNLVGNAVKFRKPGGVPHVHVSGRQVGDEWEVSVADDGIGIEPQYAERVFVIFQRLHAKDAYEGTGIGLALCRKIVEFHGGRIWIDADVADGTTIRFTLPVQARPEPVPVEPLVAAGSPSTPAVQEGRPA
ncbi:phospho-acceptor domain-containing protein [Motilibacter rhizosphaerae]|uniref:histidine kinase n=1 Tax=Motilibacter rhizosphaerae TaxID=598652 RepID=A0A4Q7NAE7_9ACTN|nr:ATP-binding protein [Motilibacter rhizosphaerae]RZS79418.1 phospho-acceptor domain-containing protein [Motilibacter rhizosphaerae]